MPESTVIADCHFVCFLYAPPFAVGESRVAELVHIVEKHANTALDWLGTKSGRLERMDDRDSDLAAEMRRNNGGILFLCNGTIEYSGVNLHVGHLYGKSGPGGESVAMVNIAFPGARIQDTASSFLEDLGDALNVWHGGILSPRKAPGIGRYESNVHDKYVKSERSRLQLRQLPRSGPITSLPGPAIPLKCMWINYWSAQTCAALNCAAVLPMIGPPVSFHRTGGGNWIVTLTEEPLDLSREDHVDTLADFYARFPMIGIQRRAPS